MRVFNLIAALSLLTIWGFTDEDHDHDHDEEHHEAEEAATGEAAQLLKHLGGELEIVEDRNIGGQEVTSVPVTAVFSEGNKTFVFAYNDGKLQRWEVNLGRSDGHYVEAKTGVFPGDRVVNRHQIHTPPQPQYQQEIAVPNATVTRAPVVIKQSSRSSHSHSSHRRRHSHHHSGHHHKRHHRH